MQSIHTQIASVRQQIAAAARAADRSPGEVRLVAVSKTRNVDEIRSAIDSGVSDFGENYVQEALPKIRAIGDAAVIWHFIGAIQSNKTRDIAQHFQWVHTVDREKIAHRLSDQRSVHQAPLDVLIQVNLDDEPRKAGVSPAGVGALAAAVAKLPRLRLRGLMAMPKVRDAFDDQRACFRSLTALFQTHRPDRATEWDTLSMGMSGDFAAAISAGSTLVRIGTAIFGERAHESRVGVS